MNAVVEEVRVIHTTDKVVPTYTNADALQGVKNLPW
eukprot:jgi/Antlo1/2251/1079